MATRTPRRLGRAGLVALTLAIVVATVTACGSPRYEYVTNKGAGAFVRIPNEWSSQRLEGPALLGIDARNLSPEGLSMLSEQTWLVGIDAGAAFDAEHLLIPDGGHPKGYVEVRDLLAAESDALSLNDLRNLVLPIDQVRQAQTQALRTDPRGTLATPEVLLLVDDTVRNADGVHGVHLVYQIRTANGLVTFDQTSLLDAGLTKLYQLVVACSARCYALNRATIEEVQSSFTVKPNS